MKIIITGTLFILVVCMALSSISDAGEEKAKQEALKSAEKWLKLVDDGDFGESWDDSAVLFQKAISKEDWVKTINGARSPLGKVISRKLDSAVYATSLPGAPDGEYVVIQFKTSFANKANAIETITPMKDPDGRWKVSGYYIK